MLIRYILLVETEVEIKYSYSNYKNTFYGYKNKCFHFVLENLVSSFEKNNNSPSPTRRPNGLADSIAAPNKKSREHSQLLYQVQQHNFKDGLIL